MNLWSIITGNSSLPVQAGNNLWDHLNNQIGGAGNVYVGTPLMAIIDERLEATIEIETLTATLEAEILTATLEADTLTAEVVQDNESTLCQ